MILQLSRSILILFSWLCFNCYCNAQVVMYDDTIAIIKHEKKNTVHQEHDIVVVHHKDSYFVYVYFMHNDTLQPRRMSISGGGDFDKTSYIWGLNNDVAIRLFNSLTNEDAKINVKGDKIKPQDFQ